MTISEVVALVPLRGGSKSIPKKNIRLIAGRPLCAWVLESAARSGSIKEVWVSTDSEEIADVVRRLNLGVRILKRPSELATDEASTEAVMLHFADNVDFDVLATIQATSPLLKSGQLDRAIEQFEAQKLDSMLSAVRTKRFFWSDDGRAMNYNPLQRPRRQEFAGTLMENGAFYLTRRAVLESHQCRLGGNIGVFEMPEEMALEIDEPADWAIVEELILNELIK